MNYEVIKKWDNLEKSKILKAKRMTTACNNGYQP